MANGEFANRVTTVFSPVGEVTLAVSLNKPARNLFEVSRASLAAHTFVADLAGAAVEGKVVSGKQRAGKTC